MNKIIFFVVQVFIFVSIAHADGTSVRPSSFHLLSRTMNTFAKHSSVSGASALDRLTGIGSSALISKLGQLFQQDLKKSDEITQEAERLGQLNKSFLKREKTFEELVKERNQRVKELKEKIAESRSVIKIGRNEPSEEEMRGDLHKLLTEPLGTGFDQKDEESEMAEPESKPGVLEQLAGSSSYVVPSIWKAPSPKPTSTETSTVSGQFTVAGGNDELTQKLLSAEKAHESLSSSDTGSYLAKSQFKEVLYFATRNQYWPRRYRNIFLEIIKITNQNVSEEHLKYLRFPITRETSHVPAESKEVVLNSVKRAWRTNPRQCLDACLLPTGSLVSGELTADSLADLKPCDFQDNSKNGCVMNPAVKELVDRLLNGTIPHSINYDSETLIIIVPYDANNNVALSERFKPYKNIFTIRFVKYTQRGSSCCKESDEPDQANDFCTKFCCRNQ